MPGAGAAPRGIAHEISGGERAQQGLTRPPRPLPQALKDAEAMLALRPDFQKAVATKATALRMLAAAHVRSLRCELGEK